MAGPLNPHVYRVHEVIRAVDGDTIDCRVGLGFGLSATFRFRLAGVDTPEVRGPKAGEEGRRALAYVEEWLGSHPELLVRTFRASEATVGVGDGAFGRWLAEFVAPDGRTLQDDLRASGHAR